METNVKTFKDKQPILTVMRTSHLFSLFLTLQISTIYPQKVFNIEGVDVPRTIQFMNENLSLNGGGTLSTTWSDVGVQALYLSELSQDPEFIISDDSKMAIRIEITNSALSAKKLTNFFNESFEKSLGKKIEEVRLQIVEFINCLDNKIAKKDVIQFIYAPADTSIWIYKNERLKCKIKGLSFKKALFGIWLSEKTDVILKNKLLGKV